MNWIVLIVLAATAWAAGFIMGFIFGLDRKE